MDENSPLKVCIKCRRALPESCFYFTGVKGVLRSDCKDCVNAYSRQYRTHAKTCASLRMNTIICRARTRSRARGLDFDLDKHRMELTQRLANGICEVSGIPFVFDAISRHPCSPSLDRIDSNGGYIYSNVRIVCAFVNTALGEFGDKEIEPLIFAWSDHIRARQSQNHSSLRLAA